MRRPHRLLLVSIATVLAVAGCARPPQASGYDDPLAKENFMATCTLDTTIDDSEGVEEGTTRTAELAPASTCECVFEIIQDTLSWDELTAYEDEVDAAEEGNVPDPPAALVTAVEQCTSQGPIAPGDDTGDATDDAGSN